MAERVSRRSGGLLWGVAEELGWVAIYGAVAFAAAAGLLGWMSRAVTRELLIPAGLSVGCVFLGRMLIAGSRQTDTHLYCTKCGRQLHAEDRSCPKCYTVLDLPVNRR